MASNTLILLNCTRQLQMKENGKITLGTKWYETDAVPMKWWHVGLFIDHYLVQ